MYNMRSRLYRVFSFVLRGLFLQKHRRTKNLTGQACKMSQYLTFKYMVFGAVSSRFPGFPCIWFVHWPSFWTPLAHQIWTFRIWLFIFRDLWVFFGRPKNRPFEFLILYTIYYYSIIIFYFWIYKNIIKVRTVDKTRVKYGELCLEHRYIEKFAVPDSCG